MVYSGFMTSKAKRKGKKATLTEELREMLLKSSIKNEAPVWKAVAKGLGRPRRKAYEVNLYRIQKFAADKETVIVPGRVLGTGDINKVLTVAALKFSEAAREKIKKAGGSCITIEELVNKNPKGSKVRIMG